MLVFGNPPILECSSKGDRRFSAFYARIRRRGNQSIEELYQGYKLFEGYQQGLSIKDAKGKQPINMEQCRALYRQLWWEYFQENPHLLEVISPYHGFSDIFGKAGSVCQAEEIYRIHQSL